MDVYIRIRVLPDRIGDFIRVVKLIGGIERVEPASEDPPATPSQSVDVVAYAKVSSHEEMNVLLGQIWKLDSIDRHYQFPLDFGEIKDGKQIAWPGLRLKSGKAHCYPGYVDSLPWGLRCGFLLYSESHIENQRLAPKGGVRVYCGPGAVPQSAFLAIRNGEAYYCIAVFSTCDMWFVVKAGSKEEALRKLTLAARLEVRDPDTGSSEFIDGRDLEAHLIHDDPSSMLERHNKEEMAMYLRMGGAYYIE